MGKSASLESFYKSLNYSDKATGSLKQAKVIRIYKEENGSIISFTNTAINNTDKIFINEEKNMLKQKLKKTDLSIMIMFLRKGLLMILTIKIERILIFQRSFL